MGVWFVDVVPAWMACFGFEIFSRQRQELLHDGLLLHRVDEACVAQVHGMDFAIHIAIEQHLDGANQLIGPVKVLLDSYVNGEIHSVHLCYTRFINTMKQEPVVEQLLPLSAEDFKPEAGHPGWDYIYEPDAHTVIEELLIRYVEALVYQAVAESMASEQSARMVAMKSATDNAGNVINELKLVYNKTRQAAITKELSEIVAGAAAV